MKLPQTGITAMLGLGLLISVGAASLAAAADMPDDHQQLTIPGRIGQYAAVGNPLLAFPADFLLRQAPSTLQTNFTGNGQLISTADLTTLGQYTEGCAGKGFQLSLDDLRKDINPFTELHFSGKKLLAELYDSVDVPWTESSYAQAAADTPATKTPSALAVPPHIPSFMILLGSSLLGIIAIRRRKSLKE